MKELLLPLKAKRRLLTLVKAHDAWTLAAAAWKRLSVSDVPKNGPEYDIVAMPVVVLYGRPFTQNGGLAPLRGYDDFSQAPNPTAFAENHSRMLDARNKLFAHVDIPGSQRLIDGLALERTDFLAVRLESDGSFSFETKSLLPDMVSSLGVPKLLAYQLSRLGNETATEAEQLVGHSISRGVVYRLVDRHERKTEQM